MNEPVATPLPRPNRRVATQAERRQCQLAPIKTGLYVRAISGTKLRDRKVGRLVAKVREVLPWLGIEDEPAIRGWAQLEVLATLVFADLRTRGIVNAQGEPRRLLTEFRQLRQAQLAYERELGMTPSTRRKLGVKAEATAPDLAAHIAAFDARRPTPTRRVRESATRSPVPGAIIGGPLARRASMPSLDVRR
jgi:hypothetical protein